MKTGMEYPMIGLVALIALAILWNAWSGQQVNLSAAALDATITGQAAPAGVTLAGEWIAKAIVTTVIGGAVGAFFAALVVWARRQWMAAPQTERFGKWQGGQNNYWGRQPKAPNDDQLMRMMLMQQMAANGQKPGAPMRISGGEDEDPIITL